MKRLTRHPDPVPSDPPAHREVPERPIRVGAADVGSQEHERKDHVTGNPVYYYYYYLVVPSHPAALA